MINMENITIKPRSESRNFYVSLASLFLLTLGVASGQEINIDAPTLIDSLESGGVVTVVTLFFVNFLNPIMKIIGKAQRGELDWPPILKSTNFLVQSLTVVLSGITLLGIAFPVDAPGEIITALETKDFVTIWIALGINIANPVYHFIRDKKKENPMPVTA